MYRNTTLVLVALLGIVLPAMTGTAGSVNTGAANLLIDGGPRGEVPFPHRTHQKILVDCNKCHDLFPQDPGAIARLKKSGDLKNKQVMNTRCVKCHKTMKQEGAKAGPTTCSQCHIKG